jgi:hypothetical protein
MNLGLTNSETGDQVRREPALDLSLVADGDHYSSSPSY